MPAPRPESPSGAAGARTRSRRDPASPRRSRGRRARRPGGWRRTRSPARRQPRPPRRSGGRARRRTGSREGRDGAAAGTEVLVRSDQGRLQLLVGRAGLQERHAGGEADGIGGAVQEGGVRGSNGRRPAFVGGKQRRGELRPRAPVREERGERGELALTGIPAQQVEIGLLDESLVGRHGARVCRHRPAERLPLDSLDGCGGARPGRCRSRRRGERASSGQSGHDEPPACTARIVDCAFSLHRSSQSRFRASNCGRLTFRPETLRQKGTAARSATESRRESSGPPPPTRGLPPCSGEPPAARLEGET